MHRHGGVLEGGALGAWHGRRVAAWKPSALLNPCFSAELLVADGAIVRRFAVGASQIEPLGRWQPQGLRASQDWIESVSVKHVQGQTHVGLASAHGRIVLQSVDGSEGADHCTLGPSGPPLGHVADYDLPNPTVRAGAGWVGLDWHPTDRGIVAVTSELQRRTHIMRGDQCERTIPTSGRPYNVAYHAVNDGAVALAIAEDNVASLIDPRAGERSGFIVRIAPSAGPVYATDVSKDGHYLALGGEDRSAFVYDTRKWAVLGAWNNALKHEIVSLFFSDANPQALIAASGTDSEISAGFSSSENAKTARNFDGMRADSRWLGVARVPGTDTVVGASAQGSLYLLENALGSSRESGRRPASDD